MIPEKIHYIWLSDEPLNASAKFCMKTWRRHVPDYEIRKWSMKDFDFSKMPVWVTEAMERGKWAFACDYLRLHVLENEGGFYLDSDVAVLRAPDRFRKHRFVSSVEYYPSLFEEKGKKNVDSNGQSYAEEVPGMAVQAAIMGSEPHHPYVRRCMEFYEKNHFIQPDGSLYDRILAPQIYAKAAQEMGFRYRNEYQHLPEDTVFYPSKVFAPGYEESTADSIMIHLSTGSWRDFTAKERRWVKRNNRKQRWQIRLKSYEKR